MHQNAGNCMYFFENVLWEDPQTPHQNMSPTLEMPLTPLKILDLTPNCYL